MSSPVPPQSVEEVFWSACTSGNLQLLNELLCQPLNVNWCDPELHRSGLYRAAGHGNSRVVARLLKDHRVDVNEPTNDSATPLFIAAQGGFEDVVSLLLLHPKTDVNAPNSAGATPLWQACWMGQEEVVRMLLMHSLVRQNVRNREGSTPLWIAAQQGHVRVVKLLLASTRNLDLDATWERNHKPAVEQALQNGHEEIVEVLQAYQLSRDQVRDQLRAELHTLGKGHSPFSHTNQGLPYPLL